MTVFIVVRIPSLPLPLNIIQPVPCSCCAMPHHLYCTPCTFYIPAPFCCSILTPHTLGPSAPLPTVLPFICLHYPSTCLGFPPLILCLVQYNACVWTLYFVIPNLALTPFFTTPTPFPPLPLLFVFPYCPLPCYRFPFPLHVDCGTDRFHYIVIVPCIPVTI